VLPDPTDLAAMDRALALAAAAGERGDVPVGAVVTDASGAIVAEGHNLREVTGDPTAHAEVVALREAAAALGSWNLSGCTLVVTLEPCLMCAGALLQARVSRLVFGAWDEKAGAAGSVYDVVRDRRLPSRAEVVAGVREEEASALLRTFFDPLR
jgi:tRNA(adenine34) deaminase